MKKLSQALALVSVTTLFATAFTTSYFERNATELKASSVQASVQTSVQTAAQIERVIITGKKMTMSEKARFDAEQQNAASLPSAGSVAIQ